MNTIMGIINSYLGLKIYNKLIEENSVTEKDQIFILSDQTCEDYFIKYCSQYVTKFKPNRVIYVNAHKNKNIDFGEKTEQIRVVHLASGSINKLIYYCTLFGNMKNCHVLAYDIPYGRNGRALIGEKGISEEDVFRIGIMGLDEDV